MVQVKTLTMRLVRYCGEVSCRRHEQNVEVCFTSTKVMRLRNRGTNHFGSTLQLFIAENFIVHYLVAPPQHFCNLKRPLESFQQKAGGAF